MPENQGWIITTSADRPIQDIASDMTTAGFSIGYVLQEIGCITGFAADETIAKLRSIPGVVDISPDRSVSIGPPDSGENW